ncbi:MAG: hypothetical protein MUC42_03175 [Bryobacter sp.]|nr:hypothetical protein [Bryobacter sp.]
MDRVPEGELGTVELFLQFVVSEHPLDRAIRLAPIDDEPMTGEEAAAIEDALSSGTPSVPIEQVKREFGLP